MLKEPFFPGNKPVIVTGGTRGLGKGIASVFARLAARVCKPGVTFVDRAGVEALERLNRVGVEIRLTAGRR